MSKKNRKAERGRRNAETKAVDKNPSSNNPQIHSSEGEALTPRAMHLLGRPQEAALQATVVEQIRGRIGDLRTSYNILTLGMVKTAEGWRQVGLLVIELEQMLPGKRLTEDFWRQLPELFQDSNGESIGRDMLEWAAKVARDHPEKIESVDDARRIWRQPELLLACDPNFQLESERGPQVRHDRPNPLALFKEQLRFTPLLEHWKELRADEHYFPGGRLREDLRETLRVELEPTIRLVDEVRKELGL